MTDYLYYIRQWVEGQPCIHIGTNILIFTFDINFYAAMQSRKGYMSDG